MIATSDFLSRCEQSTIVVAEYRDRRRQDGGLRPVIEPLEAT